MLEPLADSSVGEQAEIIREIREAYAQADCFLRVAPALIVTAFRNVLDIGPIEATAEHKKTIPISPIAGGAILAAGVVLVVVGAKRT